MCIYLVKSASYCLVQAVGNVGSAQNQDTGSRGGHPLHLHQELSLDAPRCLTLTLSSSTTQGIDLHMHSIRSYIGVVQANSRNGRSLKSQSRLAQCTVNKGELHGQSSRVADPRSIPLYLHLLLPLHRNYV